MRGWRFPRHAWSRITRTYDVLRWDGRCYTLDSDEITARDDPPPACDTADATLGFAVANLVRTVGGLPTPELVP
jgi:hypothetical protein